MGSSACLSLGSCAALAPASHSRRLSLQARTTRLAARLQPICAVQGPTVSPARTAAAAAATLAAVPEAERFDLPHTAPALHLLPHGPWTEVAGGVCAPAGFSAQGLHAGLREGSHRADVALLLSSRRAAAAGWLSENTMAGASVAHTRECLFHQQQARAVLMHHGQANVGTGHLGQQDALTACRQAACALGLDDDDADGASSSEHDVLLQSAGALGERLRLDRLLPALPILASQLDGSAEGAYHAACAMTEGDTTTKEAALEVSLTGYSTVRLGGMAHASSSGIQAVVTCDAAVSPPVWRAMFAQAAADSFGQVALCAGDCINSSIVGLANGAAGNPVILEPTSGAARRLEVALAGLMEGLAKAVAWDGRGAQCLVEVEVTGADSGGAARQAALAVASSPAVRAAISTCCPNWSSIACALGGSGVRFLPADLAISLGGMPLLHHGRPTADLRSAQAYAAEVLHLATARHGQVHIGVRIGRGSHKGKAWTFDQTDACCVL